MSIDELDFMADDSAQERTARRRDLRAIADEQNEGNEDNYMTPGGRD